MSQEASSGIEETTAVQLERIHTLARQATQHSIHHSTNPFLDTSANPQLDPNSSSFSAKAWIQTLVGLAPERYPHRSAGVSFKNLGVHGYGRPTDYQKDVGNLVLSAIGSVKEKLHIGKSHVHKIQILNEFDGLIKQGEMLVVLGRPGAGCSTFLKTISGDTHGFFVEPQSDIQYQGISYEQMHKHFRGEVIYNAETEIHFPNLTVGDTLLFAAKARTPRTRMEGVTREQYATHMRDVVMAMYGLSHTMNTRVGNDLVRGVSGGERKRVSIAECTLSMTPLQCWDNSTRGLDSATALEFIRTLRTQTQYTSSTALVAIYQASQEAYDLFDKVIVLYEGRQIYFGPTNQGRKYFENMGFICAERQTTGDFLTSMSQPTERIVKPGFETKVPRTAAEFAQRWKDSPERQALLVDIDAYNKEFPVNGERLEAFQTARKTQQSKTMSVKDPYTVSYWTQVKMCMHRGFLRTRGDATNTYITIFGNFIMSLVISSVFYNLQPTTGSFFQRGALLFFAVLTNAFASFLEILTLYAQRPIVEKHNRYALYHPSAEGISSMLVDIPTKVITALTVNLTLYFMSNLRRNPAAFFTFFLFSFVTTLTMSSIFRTIASFSRSLSEALTPASLMILALVIYTGFTIPPTYMVVWFSWIRYINPISYAFESLMVNEFDGSNYICSNYIPSGPGYENVTGLQHLCGVRGAVPGSDYVAGTDYLAISFNYHRVHLWRNLGIMFAFWVFFTTTYLVGTEYVSAKKSKGEVLVFRKGHVPKESEKESDIESGDKPKRSGNRDSVSSDQTVAGIQRQTKIFHWSDVCYDIQIKKENRSILDHVDGWVKPGTLTALMGVTGAGKTSLLDVLATRTTMGVITGEMLVNGRPRDVSFQRKTGYVQQQDLHLDTSTVREALTFSALLRQSKEIPDEEKIAYVDEVIKLLEMEEYSDAVVGVPGEGLNVEQRKRLTIGVELVAKPSLLLFFDEPTSGLDSQTAWSICQLMRKLANNGQAILCTIHQPSAILIQEFDRLLFLAKGGKTVYFGDMGHGSSTMIKYFEQNGAKPCPPDANPVEWMLEVIGAAPGHHSEQDWFATWRESPEYQQVKTELAKMKQDLSQIPEEETTKADRATFAVGFGQQFWECLKRVWQQYWRTPTYLFAKLSLSTLTALFISFSFYKSPNSQQGLQNQMFTIFMLFMMFGSLVQQIHPQFVAQRALYEARERPSKAYSWQAFLLAQIVVELPWQTLTSVLIFVSWYYPIGLDRNAVPTDTVAERGALMFLYCFVFMIFTSTFAHLTIVFSETAEAGSNLAQLCFSMCLLFCGILAPGTGLGWWIWMYRISPFTYLVSGMLSTGLAGTTVQCDPTEFSVVQPPSGQTCGQYLDPFIKFAGSSLTNPNASSDCQLCAISSTDQFLTSLGVHASEKWQNFGILWVFVAFNIAGSFLFYYWARVPKGGKAQEVQSATAEVAKNVSVSEKEKVTTSAV
ncbi:ABC-2 type transporter-domain-containing protein [Flagelloscypha sp. PMI_526]|nr:ABC-2 type transporter-domain-containing protein [Flagelloscypha sp. PMI_526]